MSKLISIGQIIDQSWSHYRKHFQELMKISLWFFLVPLLMIIASLFAPVGDPVYLAENNLIGPGHIIGTAIGIITTLIVIPILGIWIGINLIQLIEKQSKKKKVDLKKQTKESWSLVLPYIWVSILKGLIVLAPLLLLAPGFAIIAFGIANGSGAAIGVAGIILIFLGTLAALVFVVYFGVKLAFVEFDLVLGNKRGVATIKDSMAMVKGRFWATLVRLLIPNALYTVIVVIIQYALLLIYAISLGYLANLGDEGIVRIDTVVQNLITFGITAVSTPLFVIVGYVIYDSLRKAK